MGRIGGRVTADRSAAAFDARTQYGVVLHVDVSEVGGGSQIHMLATPKRTLLLADDGATLRVLDLMESVLRNGLRAPLPEW